MISTVHPSPQPKWHLNRFSRFCTDDRKVFLYFTMGRPFPPQNCPFSLGSGPHLIHGSLGPPESSDLNPNGISIGAAFLQSSLVCQTDRQTDHATRSVTIGRIYVRSTTMRPNNIQPFGHNTPTLQTDRHTDRTGNGPMA